MLRASSSLTLKLAAVPVNLGGATFESGPPTQLFEARLRTETYQAYGSGYSYDVLPDGSRFLLNVVVSDVPESATLTVTTNWTASLLH